MSKSQAKNAAESPEPEFQVAAAPVVEKKIPQRILIEETIGWTDNGVLRMFHEDQVVTNPHDIKRLLELGAKYMVVTHE